MVDKTEVEDIFFRVLDDLNEYLSDLTLVGGWLSYVYARFLWNNLNVNPVTTVDVDFGISKNKPKIYQKTIFQILSNLDYTERHVNMDRMYPVILFKEGKVRIDFISPLDISNDVVEQLVGVQMSVSRLGDFEFVLQHRMLLDLKDSKNKKSYSIFCPKPAAFVYHKSATFVEREDELKQAKDLSYIYFVLRYAPDVDAVLDEVQQFYKAGHLPQAENNLQKYFERKSSRGCLMVEKENGPDAFLEDIREDIFERFSALRAKLE